jgi:RNA polymerase sigma-70 factor (ECF subfamily)
VQSSDTDDTLIARFRTGQHPEAFTELVHRYRHPVFRLAVSILGPAFAGEAEEVAQEVFLKVHHALQTFRGEAQFSSWIYRITFNHAVNLKSRTRYRAPHLQEEILTTMAGHADNPLVQIQTARRDQALAACVSELPEIYQSALNLHYWMDTSVAEIGELLGIPENTVKSYLHRARRLLHEMLKQRGFEDV